MKKISLLLIALICFWACETNNEVEKKDEVEPRKNITFDFTSDADI